jgi:rhamnosyltransferase
MTESGSSITPQNGVCAIVVTFRPQLDVLENLRKVRPQVQALVVVDNGSTGEALAPFHGASRELDFTLIKNGENLGIAAALNVGVRWAEKNGFPWVVLFDQDSTVTDGLIDAMLDTFNAHPQPERIGLVVPLYVRRGTGANIPSLPGGKDTLQVARTSGSLIPMRILDELGGFVDEMFIDMVDYEYCLRLRRSGYLLVECKKATLIHSPAAPTVHSILGKFRFTSSNYGAGRRYYIGRNIVWVARLYWADYPSFCTSLLINLVKETAKLALVEKNRIRKLTRTLQGLSDGIAGRMGKRIEL